MKVFPAIATAYALFFTGFGLREIYREITAAVKDGDTSRLAEVRMIQGVFI